MSRRRLAVFICVHTFPDVAELTIGSFLRAHPSIDVELHVGLHSNYLDYCLDLRLFRDLKRTAQVHLVDEIDWLGAYNTCWYRYSVMHAKNLENIFRQAKHGDFENVLILDHDVFVKGDFVTPLLEEAPQADLIGSLFEDRGTLFPYKTAHGEDIYSAPKISIWHALLSRQLYEEVLKRPGMIYPKMLEGKATLPYIKGAEIHDRPVFVDTFAEVYNLTCKLGSGFEAHVVPGERFGNDIQHFYNSSFNYGYWTRRDGYSAHIDEISRIYRREFPNGISTQKA